MGIIRSFTKFGIVGLSGIGVNLAVYSLVIYLGGWYVFAAICAFLVAVTSNFCLNYTWTFKGKATSKSLRRKYTLFFLFNLIGLACNTALLIFFVESLGLHEILAQCIAVGCVSVINFFLNYTITFRSS